MNTNRSGNKIYWLLVSLIAISLMGGVAYFGAKKLTGNLIIGARTSDFFQLVGNVLTPFTTTYDVSVDGTTAGTGDLFVDVSTNTTYINDNLVVSGTATTTALCLTGDSCRTTWPVGGTGTTINQLGQIGDVATSSPMTYGEVLRFNTATSEWESVATSTLGLGGSSGTVSSVDMSVPTGLSISGNPITDTGTLALTYSSGYSIPLTASTTEGSTAYTWGNHAGLYELTGAVSTHEGTYNHTNYNTAYGWGNHALGGYLSASSYYATTTHANISSLPALSITKSQVSDFGTYGDASYNFGANNFDGTGNFTTTGSITAANAHITTLNVDLVAPGRLLIATSTAPDYAYQYDSGTGLGWISQGKQALYTGSSARLTVDSTGNVGIGTTDPQDMLHIVKSSANPGIRLQRTTTGSADWTTYVSGDNLYFLNNTYATGKVFIDYLGRTAFNGGISVGSGYYGTAAPAGGAIIEGNVGIGTTSPTVALDVVGSIQSTGSIRIGTNPAGSQGLLRLPNNQAIRWRNSANSSDTGGVLFDSNDNLAFQNAASGQTTQMVITTTGNVGIGTTSPKSALSVIGDINGGGFEKCFTIASTTFNGYDNIPLWRPDRAIEVESAYCAATSGTSAEVTVSDGTNNLDTITCDTDGQADDGSLANNQWNARELFEVDFGTITGAVDWINYCITYKHR